MKSESKVIKPKKDTPEKIEQKELSKKAYLGYMIDLGDPELNETIKMVKFVDGIGILDISILKINRPDWFNRAGEQIKGVTLEMYKEFWLDRGAKVTEVSPSKKTNKKMAEKKE